jgi:hypothetical protein
METPGRTKGTIKVKVIIAQICQWQGGKNENY